MRISDWSSDVCSSDLLAQYRLVVAGDAEIAVEQCLARPVPRGEANVMAQPRTLPRAEQRRPCRLGGGREQGELDARRPGIEDEDRRRHRSEEHTSELQSLMRISYAGFCLKKKKK